MTEFGSGSPDATPSWNGSLSMPSAGGGSIGFGTEVVVVEEEGALAAVVVVGWPWSVATRGTFCPIFRSAQSMT